MSDRISAINAARLCWITAGRWQPSGAGPSRLSRPEWERCRIGAQHCTRAAGRASAVLMALRSASAAAAHTAPRPLEGSGNAWKPDHYRRKSVCGHHAEAHRLTQLAQRGRHDSCEPVAISLIFRWLCAEARGDPPTPEGSASGLCRSIAARGLPGYERWTSTPPLIDGVAQGGDAGQSYAVKKLRSTAHEVGVLATGKWTMQVETPCRAR